METSERTKSVRGPLVIGDRIRKGDFVMAGMLRTALMRTCAAQSGARAKQVGLGKGKTGDFEQGIRRSRKIYRGQKKR